MDYNQAFLDHVNFLRKEKPVIICGDFNVAHEPIDLKNPKANTKNPGFYIDERNWFTKLLKEGFHDVFREQHINEKDHYTWWSYRFRAREKNIGWRIDYFIIDKNLLSYVKNAMILTDVYGSDHCPVAIKLDHKLVV